MTAADLSALLISLREGTEMAIVVGILLAYLRKVGARGAGWVWAGVISAIGVSLGFLAVLNAVGATFEGTMEQVFEGTTMLLAAVFLTWMILWMLRNARFLKGELQRGLDDALARGAGTWGLFLLAFFAVVREGVELALLLFAAPGEGKLVGAVAGLVGAVAVGLLIYAFGRRIDLQTFFRVTSILLVLFAAGLVAHAAHEFAEAGILSAVEGPKLWSTKAVLPDGEGAGSLLRALFGYQDEPTVIEVVTYVGYLALVWLLAKMRVFSRTAPAVEVRST